MLVDIGPICKVHVSESMKTKQNNSIKTSLIANISQHIALFLLEEYTLTVLFNPEAERIVLHCFPDKTHQNILESDLI